MSPLNRHVHRSLLATVALAGLVIGASASAAGAGNLVFNGGFETGNFLGWNVPPPMSMQNLFFVSGGDAHEGSFYGRLSSTQLQFVSQTLPTQAGQDYELSFWLRTTSPMLNETWTVRWEGQVAFAEFVGGLQPVPWTRFIVPLRANLTGSFLEFGQTAFPGEFHIDDISVVPVPAPGAVPLLLVISSAVALRRRCR